MTMMKEIRVPDIGDFKDVDVVEVLVAPGDVLAVETPMILLESDKASMEVPAPEAGVVREVRLKVGDKVARGDLILLLETEAEEEAPAPAPEPPAAVTLGPTAPKPASFEPRPPPTAPAPVVAAGFATAHASPSVPRYGVWKLNETTHTFGWARARSATARISLQLIAFTAM